MLSLAGLLFVADVFSLIQLPTLVQYLLTGILTGSFAGKSMVVWRERGGSMLDPDRVRRIEYLWTLIGVAVMVVTILAQVA
jgi:hypothetical protein